MNRIFVTGDTHCDIDIHKLTGKCWPMQRELTRDDYLIVAGDMGVVWDKGKQDTYIQKWWNKKPFTTLFVDGNHENHDALNEYPVETWNGGKIHRISDSLIHLMRGQIYTIAGKTFFTFGGAQSVDKALRKEGVSWWAGEMPSEEEKNEALQNLTKHNFNVDYVVTHDCDIGVLNMLGYINQGANHAMFGNELNEFFGNLVWHYNLQFKQWFFGHHHVNVKIDDGKYIAVYQQIYEIPQE